MSEFEPKPEEGADTELPEAPANAEELARLAARLLLERKGEDVVVLRMVEVLPVTDYFVIATGRNVRHVDALVDHVRTTLKKVGMLPRNESGRDTCTWVLLDMGPVVVHVFRAEAREYYDLEMLWADAEVVKFDA